MKNEIKIFIYDSITGKEKRSDDITLWLYDNRLDFKLKKNFIKRCILAWNWIIQKTDKYPVVKYFIRQEEDWKHMTSDLVQEMLDAYDKRTK
jgi:hypothetical protein